MTYLEGFEPVRFEKIKRSYRSKHNPRLVFEEFLESGHECMAKTFDSRDEMMGPYLSYMRFAKDNPGFGVRVSRCGSTLLLRREKL